MDLEQLKIILETIEAVGGDARSFGLWYLGLTIGQMVLSNVLVFSFGTGVLLLGRNLVRNISSIELRRVATELGVVVQGDWGGSDTNHVLDKIRRLKELNRGSHLPKSDEERNDN